MRIADQVLSVDLQVTLMHRAGAVAVSVKVSDEVSEFAVARRILAEFRHRTQAMPHLEADEKVRHGEDAGSKARMIAHVALVAMRIKEGLPPCHLLVCGAKRAGARLALTRCRA